MTYGDCTFYNNPISPLFSKVFFMSIFTYVNLPHMIITCLKGSRWAQVATHHYD